MLELSENKLLSLQSGTFEGLVKLNFLNLAHNDISALDQGVFQGLQGHTSTHSNGLKINVEGNKIEHIPLDIFKTSSI